jgi:hypothetical protein
MQFSIEFEFFHGEEKGNKPECKEGLEDEQRTERCKKKSHSFDASFISMHHFWDKRHFSFSASPFFLSVLQRHWLDVFFLAQLKKMSLNKQSPILREVFYFHPHSQWLCWVNWHACFEFTSIRVSWKEVFSRKRLFFLCRTYNEAWKGVRQSNIFSCLSCTLSYGAESLNLITRQSEKLKGETVWGRENLSWKCMFGQKFKIEFETTFYPSF